MSLLTVIVTSLATTMSVSLAIFYRFWKIKKIKQEHEMEQKAGICMVTRWWESQTFWISTYLNDADGLPHSSSAATHISATSASECFYILVSFVQSSSIRWYVLISLYFVSIWDLDSCVDGRLIPSGNLLCSICIGVCNEKKKIEAFPSRQ